MAKRKKIAHRKMMRKTKRAVKTKETKTKHIKKEIVQKPKEKKNEIHFFTEEFQYRPKGIFWFLATFIVALALFDFFFLLQQYLAMVVVILAVVVFLQHALQKPKKSFCKITSDGVEFNRRFFPYLRFKSFWISQREPKKLYLAQTKRWLPPLTILIDSSKEVDIEEFLTAHLPKQKTISEDFADRLAGILRF